MKTAIFLSLGSNINKAENIEQALFALTERFGELDISSIYESEAVGFSSDNYYNCVVMALTTTPLSALLTDLRQIEFDFGRSPSAKKNEPRALDIDLLLFGENYINTPIKLPREDIATRAFVLEPLAELIPDWNHPELRRSVSELWLSFDQRSQPQWKVPFEWKGQMLPKRTLCISQSPVGSV